MTTRLGGGGHRAGQGHDQSLSRPAEAASSQPKVTTRAVEDAIHRPGRRAVRDNDKSRAVLRRRRLPSLTGTPLATCRIGSRTAIPGGRRLPAGAEHVTDPGRRDRERHRPAGYVMISTHGDQGPERSALLPLNLEGDADAGHRAGLASGRPGSGSRRPRWRDLHAWPGVGQRAGRRHGRRGDAVRLAAGHVVGGGREAEDGVRGVQEQRRGDHDSGTGREPGSDQQAGQEMPAGAWPAARPRACRRPAGTRLRGRKGRPRPSRWPGVRLAGRFEGVLSRRDGSIRRDAALGLVGLALRPVPARERFAMTGHQGVYIKQ